MKSGLIVALSVLALLGPTPVDAQVLNNDRPALDSLTRGYHDAIIVMRDTLLAVSRAATVLTRDIASSSTDLVVTRAAKLRLACEAAALEATNQEGVFDRAIARSVIAARVDGVAVALRNLSRAIGRECLSVFDDDLAANLDSLVGWSPYYTSRIRRLPQAFLNAANELARAANFRIEARYRR